MNIKLNTHISLICWAISPMYFSISSIITCKQYPAVLCNRSSLQTLTVTICDVSLWYKNTRWAELLISHLLTADFKYCFVTQDFHAYFIVHLFISELQLLLSDQWYHQKACTTDFYNFIYLHNPIIFFWEKCK